MLTIFLAAACSFKLFINAASRVCFTVRVLVYSGNEMERFAFIELPNKSHSVSRSVLDGHSATYQEAGHPAKARCRLAARV